MATRWDVGGDFNDILHLNEKIGGLAASLRKFTLFQQRTNSCDLMDLVSSGFPYTWRGPLTHDKMRLYEKLDRIFSNASWSILYPEAHVKVLHRIEFSNHHPVLLTLVDKDFCKIPKYFKFECAWLVEDNFEHMLNVAWIINHPYCVI